MSTGPDPAAWQRSGIAEDFVDTRQTVLPLIDVQEDLVRLIFERAGSTVTTFLDLGSGDGAMSELMRSVAPAAHAVLVDFSEPMLARVERRLGDSGWQALRADLSAPGWQRALPQATFDAAISSFAIYHLTSERKRALFAEVHELLVPGAMFVNMDVVEIVGPLEGLFDERIAAAHAEVGVAHGAPGAAQDTFEDSADDQPDPLWEQLGWLGEAGFEQVEVHFKWAEGTIFGAVKPS